MNPTTIEWVLNPDGTPGYSWNPVTGCLNDCHYCYAKRLATTRLRGRAGYGQADSFKPKYHKDKLEQPLKRKKPAGIFAVDMGDLFGAWVDREWITSILEVMRKTPQHIYYILTKNPGRYSEFIEEWPENAWAGATIDKNSEWSRNTQLNIFKTRMQKERGINPLTFLSIEPMMTPMPSLCLAQVDWVIIGGLTKSNYREPGYPLIYGEMPPQKEWVTDLITKNAGYGTPIFMKNNLKVMQQSGLWMRQHPLITEGVQKYIHINTEKTILPLTSN